jgi:hypothetical protein
VKRNASAIAAVAFTDGMRHPNCFLAKLAPNLTWKEFYNPVPLTAAKTFL